MNVFEWIAVILLSLAAAQVLFFLFTVFIELLGRLV